MSRRNWRSAAMFAALVAGSVFQVFPSSCYEYSAYLALSGFDTCAVLNCQGGTYFDLCEPIIILVDCPTPVVDNNP
jgi:hypothetical protein